MKRKSWRLITTVGICLAAALLATSLDRTGELDGAAEQQ